MVGLLQLWFVLFFIACRDGAFAIKEKDRMAEYNKRGHKWPLESMVPDTPGWKRLLNRRIEQIEAIETNDQAKYNAWRQIITSALIATNYTENGWGLVRAPEHITKKLQERLHKTLEVSTVEMKECRGEGMDTCVLNEKKSIIPKGNGTRIEDLPFNRAQDGKQQPTLIEDVAENIATLNEMKPLFESWSGVELEGTSAYGMRAYLDDWSFMMHLDKLSTHVISGIYHVDRSEDAEPWPIVIEDFRGNTNQIYMEPGDLLLYEGSKLPHGRPEKFVGSYYANLLLHYRPVEFDYKKAYNDWQYAIPAHWYETKPPKEGLEELVVIGGSVKEPNCKHDWCAIDTSSEESKYLVNWYGPAPEGSIVTADWDPKTMTPPGSQEIVL